MDREEDLEGLLPYYEAELRHLHEGAAHFAAEHPAPAQRLEISLLLWQIRHGGRGGSERDTAWRHDPAPLLVRGTVVQLSLDEDAFAGTGLRLFAQVLERFFPLYVHGHSFTRLRIASARDGRRLYRGEACPGERPLL